jgi:enamine deaminase RidA (YjgF/YER057c/UK114 family)
VSNIPINPNQLARPHGYSHGMLGQGRMLAIAGQVAWDAQSQLVSREFVPQFARALANLLAVLHEAGGVPSDLMLLRLYVIDKQQYLSLTEQIGAVYRELMGNHYPAMALVQVADLLAEGALVEIEGLAMLP